MIVAVTWLNAPVVVLVLIVIAGVVYGLIRLKRRRNADHDGTGSSR